MTARMEDHRRVTIGANKAIVLVQDRSAQAFPQRVYFAEDKDGRFLLAATGEELADLAAWILGQDSIGVFEAYHARIEKQGGNGTLALNGVSGVAKQIAHQATVAGGQGS